MALTAVTCLLCCHVGFAAAKTLPRTLTCTRCGNKSQHEAAKLIRPLSPAERRAEAQAWARYEGKPQRRDWRTDHRVEAEGPSSAGIQINSLKAHDCGTHNAARCRTALRPRRCAERRSRRVVIGGARHRRGGPRRTRALPLIRRATCCGRLRRAKRALKTRNARNGRHLGDSGGLTHHAGFARCGQLRSRPRARPRFRKLSPLLSSLDFPL